MKWQAPTLTLRRTWRFYKTKYARLCSRQFPAPLPVRPRRPLIFIQTNAGLFQGGINRNLSGMRVRWSPCTGLRGQSPVGVGHSPAPRASTRGGHRLSAIRCYMYESRTSYMCLVFLVRIFQSSHSSRRQHNSFCLICFYTYPIGDIYLGNVWFIYIGNVCRKK